jgi:hypothetical protein
MRYIFLFLIGLLPIAVSSQNPLKKALIGNAQSVHYSQSQFVFSNQASSTVFVSELTDNRALNWNKQVNDSVKIEAIGDYWNYPFKVLFKNKINQDLSKANVKVEPTTLGDNMYKIDPTVDAMYPNFISYPKKGYWVLSKINMKVSKGSQILFSKSYQEYTFFSKGNIEYKDAFNSDLKEGANVAMFSSMKRLLDQFYKDLNEVMGGGTVASSNIALSSIQRTSNIENDPTLVDKQIAYSGIKDKDKPKGEDQNNYKIETPADLPPPTDGKLESAVNVLGTQVKEEKKVISKTPEVKTVVKSPVAASVPKSVITDSAKLALKKLRDDMRTKAIDSAMKLKDEMAKAAKLKEDEEKAKAKELASMDKIKKDSILKANKKILALKAKEKLAADSIKRADINRKIELAIKKREEEKLKLQASKPIKTEVAEVVKKEVEKPKKKIVVAQPKKANPTVIASTPTTPKLEENRMTFSAPERKVTPKTGNEDIGEEVKRIAREVEMEENKIGNRYRLNSDSKKNIEPSVPKNNSTSENINSTSGLSRKSQRDSFLAKMKAERIQRELTEKSSKKSQIDSLIQARKAKQESIELAIARAKAAKDSMKRIAEIKPIDPKKYIQDSIKLAMDKQRKREAILAAQKAAMEAEREALTKNPNAGEMFALVSTDPPSKLPDARTREQVLADRIFTPKSEITRDLLARVKLITPEEEAKMMNQLKTSDLSNIDSFFIEQQKNRPIPTFKPIDTVKSIIPKIEPVKSIKELEKSKNDKKAAIVEKSLKDTKAEKDSLAKIMKATAINALKDSIAKKKAAMASKTSASATTKVVETAEKKIIETPATKSTVVPASKTAIGSTPAPTPTAEKPNGETAPKTDEQKIKDLEGDIEKKSQELKDKIKKAKAW